MSDPNQILDDTDREWLIASGQAASGPGGSIRVRRRRLQDSSTDSESSSSSSGRSIFSNPASVSTAITEPDFDIVEIPRSLESAATYQTLGFTQTMAETLYRKWLSFDDELRELRGFEEVALNHIEYSGIDADAEPVSGWRRALRDLGISEELQQAIVKPGFEHLALTQSAAWWAKEAIGMRWRALVAAQKQSSARGAALRTASGSQQPPTSQRSSSGGQKLRSSSFTFASGTGRMFQSRVENEPGCTIWWKCVDRARANRMWSGPGYSGMIDLTSINSTYPSDFSGASARYYFSTLEGARFYRRYVADQAGPAGLCLVRVSVPNGMISRANPYLLHWPSELFKKTIWHCRNGRDLKSYVPEISGLDVIYGNTSKGSNRAVSRLGNWRDLRENQNLVRIDGTGDFMTQFTFSGSNMDFGARLTMHLNANGGISLHSHSTLEELPSLDTSGGSDQSHTIGQDERSVMCMIKN